MPSLLEPNARAATIARLDRLTAASTPAWGKMNVSQMLAHLTDALRMTFGELPVKPKHIPLIASFPFKQLVLYVFPFPKSSPTAPELLARQPAAFDEERRQCKALIARLDAPVGTLRFAPHPLFGPLTDRQMGTLLFKHISHHLTQFGV